VARQLLCNLDGNELIAASPANLILGNATIHRSMFHSFAGFPASCHPMAILSAMLNSLGCYYPDMATNNADHEQNCSTSTVRMVASGGANLFASVAAGVCALWGPAHGGANMAVIEMLEAILKEGDDGTRFAEAAKSGDRSKHLMGFGHRVYKNYDPRARILKEASQKLLSSTRIKDPVLDIALSKSVRK
jgi:citrate synthase